MSEVDVSSVVSRLNRFFDVGQTRRREYRLELLNRLESSLLAMEGEILAALKADLGKSEAEAYTSEIAVVLHELHFTRKNLKRWMKPECVKTPLHLQPARSRILKEPRGVCLIIGPWNYPVQLLLAPLIGAIAAGNCAVVKPSELAPKTSAILAKLLGGLGSESIAVIEGGIEPTTALLNQRFDHIFFTGSTQVGQIVYAAAAKNLTPVTLELGGKSPAFVTADANLALAARRLVWGKFMNAGQTCVAPDYIYVDETIVVPLIEAMKAEVNAQLGANPRQSSDYGRIVNLKNFQRLEKLMFAGKIVLGGEVEVGDLYIAPTIFSGIEWNDPIMQEEIFGPLLPVLTYKNLDDALGEVRRRDKPLAAYMFSDSEIAKRKFLDLSFGGGCFNDTVLHLVNGHLPFGGVGASGIGAYHGKNSFLTFSHQKAVVYKSKFFDAWVRYPPFKGSKAKWLKALFKLSSAID